MATCWVSGSMARAGQERQFSPWGTPCQHGSTKPSCWAVACGDAERVGKRWAKGVTKRENVTWRFSTWRCFSSLQHAERNLGKLRNHGSGTRA